MGSNMRFVTILAGAAVAIGLLAGASAPVLAGGGDDCNPCTPAKKEYQRHYTHVDPYHWRYAPRGYYPYYANAGYWRVSYQKPRYRYAPGWGYPGAVRSWSWKGPYDHSHHHHRDGRHFNWEY